MSQTTIIRNQKGLYCIYSQSATLYVRSLTASTWTRQRTITQSLNSAFTVSVTDSDICVLYQQSDGSICLACEKNEWIPRIILKNTSGQSPDVIIHSILQKNGMQLLYGIKHGGEQKISLQYRQGEQTWSQPYDIDGFYPFESKTFRLLRLNDDKYILLYIKRLPEERVGYRIITPEKVGSFQNIYATGYNISDYSVFARRDILHLVFLVTTPFNHQIVYTATDGTKPLILAEGRGISNCCTAFANEKIYVWWTNNKRLYQAISYDYGTSFAQAQRYPAAFDESTKADYITTTTDENFAANDIYVRKTSPWDIQLWGDIYPDFFCCQNQTKDETADIKNQLAALQAKLSACTAELEQKNEKIYQLNRMLKMKNDELIAMEKKIQNR